jgi:hypothetical protein
VERNDAEEKQKPKMVCGAPDAAAWGERLYFSAAKL